jgi:isoleucyl-tRNA synthetase
LVVDTVITDELRLEGDVRDLVRAIQDARKEAGYNVADRITLSLKAKDASTNSGFVETLLATWQ